MKLYPAIVNLYQQLYAQATLRKNYVFTPPRQDRLLICKFCKWLYKTYSIHQITETLLIDYFEFQFARYSGVQTPKGKNNIMLNWIVGPKAIQAWVTRNVKKRYLVRWRCNKDFKLTLSQAFKKTVTVNVILFTEQVNQYEEREKQRFYNKKQGYLYCAAMTTLYTPNSNLCTACDFKIACIERLACTYPQLYKKRITYEQRQPTAAAI